MTEILYPPHDLPITGTGAELIDRHPRTDEHALNVIIGSYAGASESTIRAYEKEFGRFLLWVRATRTWAPDLLRRISAEDINDYAAFLLNPRPFTREFLEANGWKHPPFRGPLGKTSRGHAIRVVKLLFTKLQNLESDNQQPYVRFNPAVNVATQYKQRGGSAGKVRKAFTQEEWEAVLETIEGLPRNSGEEQGHYHRTRWIFQLMYHAFLRIGDVAKIRMNSFVPGSDGWRIDLTGKGDKHAEIVATTTLIEALTRYRVSLGLAAYPSADDDSPAVRPLRKRSGGSSNRKMKENEGSELPADSQRKGLTEQAIYLVCKEVFRRTADRLEETAPHAALRLLQATPHWLRHTGITHAMDKGIDPRYVQAQARHASLNVTAIYDHKDERKWRNAFETMADNRSA